MIVTKHRSPSELRAAMEQRKREVKALINIYRRRYGDIAIVLIKDQPEVTQRPYYGIVISPSSFRADKYQATYFDANGFSGHEIYDTLDEAVFDMYTSGFRRPDPKLLDRLVLDDRFQDGVKKSFTHTGFG